MLYRKKYNVDPSDVVDGAIKWRMTGNGAYIIADNKGTKYFVKRYTMGPRIPSKSIPEPIYSEQLNNAKWLENKQAELRKRFKNISVDTDHIVVEEENFWDDDNLFVTVTKMIPDEIIGFDYSTLKADAFIKLCSDIAVLIQKAHDAGVTHGDLKEKNILIQKKGTELIPYLIDFDSSYPSDYGKRKRSDGKPMLAYPVVHSEGYQSPEIAIYNFEDEGVVDAATITDKTDIFTLAIIFHKLWTGNFPAVIGDSCPVGEAVYLGEEIKTDCKFDISLGSTNDCKFSSLLMWMMAKDPAARPTAQQVVDALSDKLDVEDMYETTASALRFDLEPHEVHKSALEIYTKETLRNKDVKSFNKITEGGQYRYLVKMKDGSERKLTLEEVISNGYGKAKKTTVGALWEDDAKTIEFVSVDELSAQGILSVESREALFKKFYFVRLRSGNGYTTSKAGLVERGIARYKVIPDAELEIADTDKPWPEHGISYNKEALKSRSVVKVERVTEGDEKKYQLTVQRDGNKQVNIVKVSYMKIMKFIQ